MSRRMMDRIIAPASAVRCAIYTRKSSEEGLDQDFNSLDAQREAAESYIASQRHEGWVCIPEKYDDGGFTGGNLDRPALKRLLRDIEAGKIDTVVVYKVDRLSRSLMDFTRLIETFDKHKVSFVSVTQQFNTASSMGRLVLNVLLSFAQFEREIISERTRDKLTAMRRKGMWLGGLPPLGYDADPDSPKLIVNETEAHQVRTIFKLYREHGSLLPVVEALDEKGWTNKRCTTKGGNNRGGKAFTRTSLHRLLTNVTYVGKVKLKNEIHEGLQPAIVDQKLFREVQELLCRNGQTGGSNTRTNSSALLKGLLFCSACNAAMTPTHTVKGTKKYRYYQCVNAAKRGHKHCPAGTIPASPVEEFTISQLRAIGRDPELVRQTVRKARSQEESMIDSMSQELRVWEKERTQANDEIKHLSPQLTEAENAGVLTRISELRDRVVQAETRIEKTQAQLRDARSRRFDEVEIAKGLRQFDEIWTSLTPREQARITSLIIDRVDYDAQAETIDLHFHATGIDALSKQLRHQQKKEGSR